MADLIPSQSPDRQAGPVAVLVHGLTQEGDDTGRRLILHEEDLDRLQDIAPHEDEGIPLDVIQDQGLGVQEGVPDEGTSFIQFILQL